ncbi:MAG: bifunctional riboflavin kinase/FAD synthetase [Candidatus Cloacimonetes bacterium HGW-Cloacimonetes-1]|jgi:riboflavin kinase/FMN adenylyltransferase|nr:MAG: bifunctional riboflavin kinase/FAD synthetase [Candidatus Cloacimonetes bacterium HGW-Cloacimonetes-1]
MNDTILTIGTFDGVHQGHQKLLHKMFHTAKRENLTSVVITYSDHPAHTFKRNPDHRVLTPLQCKLEMIKEMGIEHIELLDFTEDFAKTKARVFLSEIIMKRFNPRIIVVGYDSHFGYQREGTYAFLRKQRKKHGYETMYVSPTMQGTKPVSSTSIRNMLSVGDLDTANKLLNRPYRMFGKVVHGQAIGRELGFPTANIELCDAHQLIPRLGIYLSKVLINNDSYFGLTNIGKGPTVRNDGKTIVETYVIDLDQDLYGCDISIDFLRRLRDEKLFGTKEELIDAMRADLSLARTIISNEILQ